jgi:hypothetical protein
MLSSFIPTDLGFPVPSAAIPFIQIRTRMAPKASRQKGKGAVSDEDGALSHLPKGSWEGSWVKEKRIELLRQGRLLSPVDLVGCCPAGGERVPAPQSREAVVFYDHFPRGFALPASNILRQFMDHFHLQPHHIGANAMMTLAAFAALCEAYLGIWPNVELFWWLIYLKTQTADSIPVVSGAASFYARKSAHFPGLKGKESCKKWQCVTPEFPEIQSARYVFHHNPRIIVVIHIT